MAAWSGYLTAMGVANQLQDVIIDLPHEIDHPVTGLGLPFAFGRARREDRAQVRGPGRQVMDGWPRPAMASRMGSALARFLVPNTVHVIGN